MTYNLNREELIRRFVTPYHKGETIIIDGKPIPTSDVHRIRIARTRWVSYDFITRLKRLFLPRMLRDNYSIFAEKNNVTDKFITKTPGSELSEDIADMKYAEPSGDVREVFVVHGRNEKARKAMFEFLRSIGLDPLEWSEDVNATGKATPYIGEILDTAFSRACAVVVLFTPDDEARLKEQFRADNDPPYETELTGQARPNVLFEAGRAMARDQDRTVLVELGQLRPFTDVAGLHVIRLDNSSQRRQDLAQRLQTAGCPVKLEGTDWHSAGDFDTAVEESSESISVLDQHSAADEPLELSDDAIALLMEATKNDTGVIRKISTLGGLIISANDRSFVEEDDARSEARWKQAFQELVDHGLIEDPTGKGQFFQVTHSGFQLADSLRASGKSDAE